MNEHHLSYDPQRVWVSVCTYQRLDLLQDLLASLKATAMPTGATIEHPQLIVVDNAETPQAAELVAHHYPQAKYVHQPRPGIAAARNAGLDALNADAQAVIFIDDDERVASDWFTALLDCAQASGADAVAGPVVPDFGAQVPEWVDTYGYVRRTDFPTGPWQRRPATNNTLVRAEWFTRRGFRFDEAFNFIGGSDSDLFERMAAAGARYWWCAEAVVEEDVPATRQTQSWLRSRAVRGGHVRVLKHQRLRGDSLKLRARLAAEGLARIGYGSLRRSAARLKRKPVTYTDDYYVWEGIGMLQSLSGPSPEEYGRD